TGTGNGNFTGQVYSVDRVAPTVTVNQAAGQADPTNSDPINFTAVFSEPINTGTFTSGDVTIGGTAGGTKTVTLTEIAPHDGTTFNVAVSGITTAGTVIGTIPSGGVSDPAGNLNAASTSADNTVTFGRNTSTSVSCSPTQVTQGGTTSCIATVTDVSPGTASAPTGTITFSDPAGGTF